ncbi:MAG: phosphate propanoyltransferase [Candidatus Faecousia sp.]|nr:phosphate propanoyltransferase [Candidatus Faecousia sp.]
MDLNKLTEAVCSQLFIELEASGRHVHLTKEQAQTLFGHGLTPERPLSQPGQFLARERVTVQGPKGDFRNVAVLGPERTAGQVEISLTDGRVLGIAAPVRLSGNISGTPGAILEGPRGTVRLSQGVIVAQRHVHLTPQAAEHFGVKHGQLVRLRALTDRPLVFEEVAVRVSPDFAPYAHLDYDEANACGFRKGDFGRIEPCGRC